MKPNATPWPAIRWMAAGTLYLLTVAIALDQVKTRQARIDEMEAGLKNIQAGLSRLQVNNQQQIDQTEAAIQKLENQEAERKKEVISALRSAGQ